MSQRPPEGRTTPRPAQGAPRHAAPQHAPQRPANQAPQRPTQGRPQQRPTGRPPQRPVQRRRKKKNNTGKIVLFIIILLVVLIIASVIGVKIANKGNTPSPTAAPVQQTQYTQDTTTDLSYDDADIYSDYDKEDIAVESIQINSPVKIDDLRVTQGLNEDWTNILLLGSDARVSNESSRTDTMIICSVNNKTGAVKLSSILRDTAVEFNDIGQYNGTYRINAANYFGGPNLIMRTINEHLGMNIEYYALVDFTSFSIIAERLGGIDITISEDEMNQINLNAQKQYKIAKRAGIDESELEATNHVKLETYGENTHLNGRQTLAYARIRKIDSDISRAERQRTVLIALLNKVKTRSMIEIMGLSSDLFRYISTNMSLDQLMGFATTVLGSNFSDVEQLRLPINDSYVQETRNEQSMLYDTDWALNAQQLHTFIYEQE